MHGLPCMPRNPRSRHVRDLDRDRDAGGLTKAQAARRTHGIVHFPRTTWRSPQCRRSGRRGTRCQRGSRPELADVIIDSGHQLDSLWKVTARMSNYVPQGSLNITNYFEYFGKPANWIWHSQRCAIGDAVAGFTPGNSTGHKATGFSGPIPMSYTDSVRCEAASGAGTIDHLIRN